MIEVWPAPFTIDLGHQVSFSRMKLFQRQSSVYAANNVRLFEIYGSNDPSLDGSWSNWTKMGSFEVIKPSGSESTSITNEDKEVAKMDMTLNFHHYCPLSDMSVSKY